MTTTNTITFTEHVSTGVETEWPFMFDARWVEQVKVFVDGVDITSSAQINLQTKTVVYGPVDSGAVVLIRRETPPTQNTDLETQGPLLPQTLEDGLDKLTHLAQEFAGRFDHAGIQLGGGKPVLTPAKDPQITLPEANVRKGRVLEFDPATGAPVAVRTLTHISPDQMLPPGGTFPTVYPDGRPLQDGTMFYHTGNHRPYYWDGGTQEWKRIYPENVDAGVFASTFNGSDADALEAASSAAAASQSKRLFIDRVFSPDRFVTLDDGVEYVFLPGAEINADNLPIANNPYVSYYHEPMVRIRPGNIGVLADVQADLLAPRSVDIDTITSANGTAAVTTNGDHGLNAGDYVWILSPSGWYQALEDSGAFYFLSQLPSSHNMLALGEPKLITAVPAPNKFEFACDPNAPASCSIAYALKAQTNSHGIKVTDASGFQAGDYIRVESDRLFDSATVGGGQSIRQAEYLMVDRVDVASGWIYVHSGPWLDYTTAEHAKVAKVNFAKPVRFINPRIKGRGSTGVTTPSYGADTGYTIDATGDGGLQVWLNEHVEIIGADIRGCERFSIDVQQNYRTLVKDTRLYLESTNDAGRETGNCPLPYGINIGGCSVETTVDGFFAEGDFRHAICEAMDGSFPGFAKDIHIHNAHIRGGLSDYIATHYPNRMIVAENIIGEGAANVSVLECRAGRVHARNVRAHGVNRAVWLFGDVRDVRLENIHGFGLLNEVIYIRPTMATMPGDARSLVIRDVFGDNVKRLLTVYASGGTGKDVEVDVVGARAYDCRQEPLYITSDANVELNVENFFGRRVCTHAGIYIVLLSGGGAFSGKTEDLVVKDSPNVERRVTYTHEQYLEKHGRHEGFTRHDVLVQIQNGELVLHRGDDFTINVRGEGYTSDDLDKIVGLKHGQRITLLRYSETITIRDGYNSGAGAAGIQTPGSADFALSSPNHIAVVHGNSTGNQVYAVVETKRIDT